MYKNIILLFVILLFASDSALAEETYGIVQPETVIKSGTQISHPIPLENNSSTGTYYNQNLQNAVQSVDNAEIELRNDYEDAKIRLNDAERRVNDAKKERKIVRSQYVLAKKRIRSAEAAKRKIQKAMSVHNWGIFDFIYW